MSTGLYLSPDVHDFIHEQESSFYTALSGPNNSGKSMVLKKLYEAYGDDAYMISPGRIYTTDFLNNLNVSPTEKQQLFLQFTQNFAQEGVNNDTNFLDLNRVLSSLKDKQLTLLFKIVGELIGSKFFLDKEDPERDLSRRFINMDGQTLALGSTGTRLLMTMLAICLDTRWKVILIDEPEMGLSPKIQTKLVEMLLDTKLRTERFSHLEHVYIASHSHIFLDKHEISNNYKVTRAGSNVNLSKVGSLSDLHKLQFNLLGNSLEQLSFPSAIVIVEGVSDCRYLKRVLELKFNNNIISVLPAVSSNIKDRVKFAQDNLGENFMKNPYRERFFVILDSVHSRGLQNDLETRLNVLKNNIIVWGKNGIEFLYPTKILSDLFGVSEKTITGELNIVSDDVIARSSGVSFRKLDLCDAVTRKLSQRTIYPRELQSKLISPINRAII